MSWSASSGATSNSDKPAGGQYSFDQQKGDVLAVMDALGLGKVTLVGHDSCGSVALNFALDHLDRIKAVGLMNSFYASSPVGRLPELIALFAEPSLRRLARAFLTDPKQLT